MKPPWIKVSITCGGSVWTGNMCTDVFHCMINIDCMLCYSMYLPMHVAVTLVHVLAPLLSQFPMLSSVPSQLIT